MLIDSVPPATIDIDKPGANAFDRVHDGSQAGSAHAVDRFGGHLVRETGLDRRLPRDVHAGAGLQHASEDHLADRLVRGSTPVRSLRE